MEAVEAEAAPKGSPALPTDTVSPPRRRRGTTPRARRGREPQKTTRSRARTKSFSSSAVPSKNKRAPGNQIQGLVFHLRTCLIFLFSYSRPLISLDLLEVTRKHTTQFSKLAGLSESPSRKTVRWLQETDKLAHRINREGFRSGNKRNLADIAGTRNGEVERRAMLLAAGSRWKEDGPFTLPSLHSQRCPCLTPWGHA